MANINGTNNNDTLVNQPSNDMLNGQAGTDTVAYQSTNGDVQIRRDAQGQLQIRDLNTTDGNEGTDTLTAIERVQFSDSTWQLIGETRVNTTTANFQLAPAVTTFADGSYVVAWQSNLQDGSGLGIYAQRFDRLGQAMGAEFRINTFTQNDQSSASLTALADGSVIATWQSIRGADTGIFAQRIGVDGSLIGAEFAVNSPNIDIQGRPQVTALADGGFVVAWESNLQDDSGYGIYSQRFDAMGGVVGAEVQVNTVIAFDQTRVSTTSLTDGGYVLVWQSNRQDGSGFGVYGQRVDALGQTVGGEFLVNTATANSQQLASVAALSDGGFVVAWQSNLQDGSGFGIYSQRFDAAGQRVGLETAVNTTTANDQRAPRVLALASGGYVVVWQSDLQDGSAGGVYGQVFDVMGTAIGGEFVINTTTTDEQVAPALSSLADGGFVVTWQSNLQDGSGYGIYKQHFNALGQPMVHTLVGSNQNDTFRLADTATNLHLQGGVGNDTYVINGSTQITELADQGTDNVISSQSYTLGDNLENLSLTGSADINAIGNALNNALWGNSGNNILTGLDGDDVIRAGFGRDQLFGGAGNDELDGGADADLMVGGTGDDVYVRNNSGDVITELAGEGIDTVFSSIHYSLGENIENVVLTGSYVSRSTGNALDNHMTGNQMSNTLRGRAGNDTIFAGSGNDIISGDDGDDQLFGENGDDQLTGGLGNDMLNGGSGIDQMTGGAGNDMYVRNNSGDVITELANEGIDTVQSSIHYILDANIENAQLIGENAIKARGNELDNVLTGNDQSNQLDGRAGNDTLIGGKGADTYLMTRGSQSELIIDQDSTINTHDVLQFTGAVSQEQLWFSRQGDNLVVTIIGTTDQATIQDWYNGKQSRVEIFASGNGRYLSAVDVQNLVDAMANLALPDLGQTSLRGVYRTQLLGVINANWSTEYPDVTAPDAPMVSLLNDTGISATDVISSVATLKVAAETGALVEYSSDNLTWSTTAPTAVEGSNTVYVRQTDRFDNQGVAQRFDFVIDTIAPTTAPTVALDQDTGLSSTDGIISLVQLTVTSLDADATAQYSLDGQTWSDSLPTLVDGSYTVYVRQVDVAGNPSPVQQISFVLDTQIAALAMALDQDTGRSDSDLISSVGTFSVTGTEDDALVEYSTDGNLWSATAPTAVEGSNTIYVRQTDIAGNVSNSTTLNFILDTRNPAALTISLDQDTGNSADLITAIAAFSLTDVEAEAVVEYSVDGNTWSTTAPAAVEGINTVFVRQTDVAGNVSPVSTLTFTLDSQVVALDISLADDTGTSDTDTITSNASLSITGQEAGAVIEYSTNGGDTWSQAAPVAVEGRNSISVRQIDVAGNISTSTTLNFVLDTLNPVAPTISLDQDTGDSTDLITAMAAFSLTDVEAEAVVEYSVDGNTWSTTAPTAVEGINTVFVRQTDVAGNTSAATSLTFVLDTQTQAPNVQLSNDTGAISTDLITNIANLTVTGEDGALIEYSADGNTWTTTVPTAIEGSNTVYVRQTDAARNTSAATSLTFVLDTQVDTPTAQLEIDSGRFDDDGLTNSSVLMIAATESGASIEYSSDGQTWSTTAPTPVQGANTFSVRQVDVAGNVSAATSVSFTFDSIAPDALRLELDDDTGLSNADNISSNGILLIRGLANDVELEYSIDGINWDPSTPIPEEGLNSISIRQVDRAGNASAAQTITFTLDTTAPVAPIITLSQDTGNSATDLLTNMAALSLAGVESGALVEYSIDGGESWSNVAPRTMEGTNTVWVRQTDVAGNVSDATEFSFVLDTQIADLSIVLDQDTGSSNSDLISSIGAFVVSGTEDGALVEYSTDGGMTWSATAPTAVEGSNSISVRQTDAAGNVSTVQQINFTLDTQIIAPTVALSQDSGTSDSDQISNVGTLSVTGTEDGALIEYSTDGDTWSATAPTAVEGSNTILVRQTDVAGNVSAATSISFTLDTQISTPTLSLNSDTGTSANDLISKVGSYSVANVDPDTLVEYSTDGNTWSTSAPAAMEGSNTIHVRQTDVAGNVASSSLTFTLDTQVVAPTVALAQDSGRSSTDRITNISTLSVTGTEVGAVVEYSRDGMAWSTTQPTATQGANTVHVRQTDVAGNTSAATMISFTFDSVAPAQPRIELDRDTGISNTDLISSSGALLVRGLASDVQLQYSTNGTTWSTNSVTPIEGLNTVFIRQVDRAGNASAAQSITFTLDTSAAAPIVTLTNDTGLSNTDRITNRPGLTVQAEDGALIEYSHNGTTWTTGIPIAGAGLNTVFVRQTDKAGNVSAATQFSFTLDVATPNAPMVSLATDSGLNGSDLITNNGIVNVQTEAGGLVEYSTDGTNWSTTQPSSVEGRNTLFVRQTDVAGNRSATTQFNFTLDTQDPDALDVGLNNDTGNSNTDLLTSDASFFVHGTEIGALVEYSTDNGTTWSATAPTPVEGSNTILLRQTDVAGNVSASTTLSFKLDTTALAPTVALSSDTGLSNADLITQIGTLGVSGTEDGVLIEYSTDNQNWSSTAPTATEGNNSIWVRQTDVAGNVSRAQQINFVLDTSLPVAPMVEMTTDTGLVGDDRISNIGTLSVTGTEEGALIEYSADSGETWSSTAPTATEGENTVLVRQTDVSGNVSASTIISFTFDTMADAPTVVLTNDTGASDSDLITSRSGLSVTDTEDGALIEYSLDGNTWLSEQPPSPQGSTVLYVRQTDLAGNVSAIQTINFTYDTLVDVPVLSLEEDTGASDSDLITRNAQLNVANLEAGSTWAYQIDGMGDWIEGTGTSFNAIEGEHSYVVRQTDVAGNVQDSVSLNVNAILEPAPISAQVIDGEGNVVESGFTNDPNAVLRLSGAETDTWQYRELGTDNWQEVIGSTDLTLNDGAYSIETRKIDVAGNFVATVTRVKVDTVAATPSMTLLEDTGVQGDALTTNPMVQIGGLEAQSIWEIRVKGEPNWNPSGFSDNQFKLMVGTHTYEIRQTDRSGNISEIGEFTFTYQSAVTEPSVTLAQDTGLSANDLVSSNSTINVGLLPESTAWQFSIDGGEWIDGTGSSFEMLTDGIGHDYAVRQQAGGLWSEPTTIYQATFDNTAPADFTVALAVDSGISSMDGITNQDSITLTGLEIGTRLEYRTDGGEWQGLEVATTDASLQLEVGTHAYEFRQVDTAGNMSSTISRTYTYINADLTAPSITVAVDTGRLDNDNVTSNRQIDVALAVTGDGITWQYQVDGNGTWINGTGTSFNALAGQHSYQVRQVDVAGNTSPVSAPLVVTADTIAPIFTSSTTAKIADADSERPQLISSSQVLYTAAVNDNTAQLSMAENDIFNFDAATGQLTFKQATNYQQGGNNTYSTTLTAMDAAGNSSQRTVTIEVARTNTATPTIELAEIKSGFLFHGSREGLLSFSDQSYAIRSGTDYIRRDYQGNELSRFKPVGTDKVSYVGVDGLDRVYIVQGKPAALATSSEFSSEYQVVRFNKDGSRDLTYGNGGVVTILPSAVDKVMVPVFESNKKGSAISVGSDGQLALYFTELTDAVSPNPSTSATGSASVLVHLSSSGGVLGRSSQDYNTQAFSFDQLSSLDFGSAGQVYAIRNDGKIQRFVNGTPDNSYATSSLLTSPSGAFQIKANDQGQLYVLGSASGQSFVMRYNANGSLDTSFGVAGKVVYANQAFVSDSAAMDIDATGTIYVVTASNTNDQLYRINSNGVLDTGFASNGVLNLSFSGVASGGTVRSGVIFSISIKNGKLYVYGDGNGDQSFGGNSRVIDLEQQAPQDSFGAALLTINEGNRPIGLLNPRSLITDADLIDKSYDGVTISIQRNGSTNVNDVFAARGDLLLTDQGRVLWQNQDIGSYTNGNGRISMTFNSNASHQIVNDALDGVTYRNSSTSTNGAIQLRWTISDNDLAGAKSSSAVQTINIRDDFADVGDSRFLVKSNNILSDFSAYTVIDGKKYYVSNGLDTQTRTKLDGFFNFGEDTTVTSRTAVLENGVQVKLLTMAELTALWNSGKLPSFLQKSQIDASATGTFDRKIMLADQGPTEGTHYIYNPKTQAFEVVSDTANLFYYNTFVEVIDTPNPTPAFVQPAFKLLVDNGDSNTDRLTSDGRLEVIGLNSSFGYQLSTDGGNTWSNQVAGNTIVTIPEGTYAVGSIQVRQTDLSGFTDKIVSTSIYKIDKSIKSLGLVNDQGLSLTDGITADGRISINGLDLARPYEYSLDNGVTWQVGTLLAADQAGFTLATGSYAAGQIRIRQTDENGFTGTARNTTAYQIDTLVGQGSITLVKDNGEDTTDSITSDDRVQVNGLMANKAFEYSINGGQSWTSVAASNSTKATFSIAEGSYAPNMVLVRQADDTGFSTVLSNRTAFSIDKTAKAVELLNDQGVTNFDNITADGRIVVKGLNPALSYQYSTDGGSNWITGSKVGDSLIFSVGEGVYAINKIQVRQTDANNLTTVIKNTAALVISPTNGQGVISINSDSGLSITDNITNDNRFNVTGLRDSIDWQYSLDAGSTWQAGTRTVGAVQSVLLPDGSYATNQVHVRQVDSAGFTTTIKNSVAYVVDKSIATASVTLLSDTGFSSTDGVTADGRVRFDISGTLSSGDVWSYSLDGGSTWTVGSGTTQTITLSNATYAAQAIRVKVTDTAGNASTASINNKLVVDNTDTSAPVFTSPTQVAVVDRDGVSATKVLAAGQTVHTMGVTDANTVYYSLSGQHATLFNINASGQISFKANTNLTNPQGDNYNVTVTATDAFGNTGSQNITVGVRDVLRLNSKSVLDKYNTIESTDDLVLTFNQNIVFDPTGKITIAEPNSNSERVLDLNNPAQVQIIGNKLIIHTDALQGQGTYSVNINGGVKSAETGEKWSSTWSDSLGFSLSKEVIYDEGALTPKDSFEVKTVDGANKKGKVTVLGDVNGDGIDDWAVSYADGDSLGRNDNGKVYVVYGRTDDVAPNLNNVANGQGGYLISGRSGGDLAGGSVSAAGDVNGDGLQDLLIHAKGANGGLGKGYVVYGRTSASNLDLGTLEFNSSFGRMYSNNVSDSFGAVGDVNGDGYDDIAHGRGDLQLTTVVTKVSYSPTTFDVKGKIVLKADWFSFAADWIDTVSTVVNLIDDPLTTGTELLLERLEDEQDDGGQSPVEEAMANQLREVLGKLAPDQALFKYDVKQSGGGGGGLFETPKDTIFDITYTIIGSNKTTTTITTTLNGAGQADIELGGAAGYSGTRSIIGNINGEQLGAQTVALGDINGDGRADYGVLDTGSGNVMARVNVVLGSRNTDKIFTSNLDAKQEGFRILDPNQTKEYVGNGNVTGLGDVNGDGISDFALTLDSYKAATYVVYGRAGMNTVDLAQIAAGNGGYQLRSASVDTHVDAIGDFNGDGLDDFVFYNAHTRRGETYNIYVVYGSTSAPNLRDFPNDAALGQGQKGFVIQTGFAASDAFIDNNAVSAGDINGDGLSDLVIRGANGDSLFLMGSTDNGKYSQIKADQVGTTGNDVLTSTGAQLIVADLGNDTITTRGADVILAGVGNDRIIIESGMVTALQSNMGSGGNIDQLAKINGGAGIDTLQLSGGVSLDFTRISNKITDLDNISGRVDNIEVIDMLTDTAGNTLRLTISDVLDMANSNVFNTNNGWSNVSGGALSGQVSQHQLSITGTSNDVVQLRSSEWVNTGATVREQSTGEIYAVYQAQNTAAQLLIDRDAQVSFSG